MKFTNPIVVALLCTLLNPLPAMAADKDGNYAVWGVGAKSCYHYGQAVTAGQADIEQFRNYVMGYLTAYNALTENTYNIGAGKNLDQIMTWMSDYCAAKQIHTFEQALAEFTSVQYPERSRQPPNRFGR